MVPVVKVWSNVRYFILMLKGEAIARISLKSLLKSVWHTVELHAQAWVDVKVDMWILAMGLPRLCHKAGNDATRRHFTCRLAGKDKCKDIILKEVRDRVYTPNRPEGLPWVDRRYRGQLLNYSAKEFAVTVHNNVTTAFVSRLKKWCQAKVKFRFAHAVNVSPVSPGSKRFCIDPAAGY